MPFSKDPGKRENPDYCTYCFRDGKLCYEGDFKGFQKICRDAMLKQGMNPLAVMFFVWSMRFAPRWKK
jgi:hypothetical protein